MKSAIIMAIAAATFLSTLVGGLAALSFRDRLHLILGFSAGAVIAVAFFDLIPESLRLGEATFGPNKLLAITAAGFFAYVILDRLVLFHTHQDGDHGAGSVERGWAAATSLSAHSFMDGLAIGIGFQASAAIGLIVAVAVLAHDFSDGMNTVNLVLKNHGTRRQAFRWLLLDGMTPMLGAATSLFIHFPPTILSEVLALFSGFFLYIGASDLLPDSYHAHPKVLTTLMTLLGAAVLYFAVRLAQ